MLKTEINITGMTHFDESPGHTYSYLRQACSTAIFRDQGNEKWMLGNVYMSLVNCIL
jgi:hypothetical protein